LDSAIRNFRRLGILDLGSYYHNRALRWAGHAASMPMNRALRQLLTGWVAHPRPIGCQKMNFGGTLKKALKRNDLPTDFVTWIAIARDMPRWRLLTNFTPAPSPPTLNPPTSGPPTPSPPTPNQPPANPNALLPGYGNLAPAYVVPTWYAPLAQAQYAETRAADRAPHLSSTISRKESRSAAEEVDSELCSTISRCFVLGRRCFVARNYFEGQYFYWAVRLVFENKRGN
jgi:hypothetical protein